MARQGKVAQDHAPLQDALAVKNRVPGLSHHGFNGGPGLCKIVRRGGKLCRKGRRNIFQVGQPDVDEAAPGMHALHGLVAAGVADDGQMQPLCPGQVEGSDDPGPPLPRRDKVDVVGSLRLQVQKDLGQALYRDLPAQSLGADGVVLAEAALESAAGEEHRAAAPGAADAGLLPEVQGSAGRFQGAARPAEARLPGGPVGFALPGAESAGFRHGNRNGFGHNIQVLCKRFDRITLVYYTIYDMECGIL